MEFKEEEFVEREIEIAGLLMQHYSLNNISQTTGLSKKIVAAHIRNMMQKVKAANMGTLIQLLKAKLDIS